MCSTPRQVTTTTVVLTELVATPSRIRTVPELVVVAEQLLAPVPGGTGRYTRELLRALPAAAPAGWTVSSVVALHSDAEAARVDDVAWLANIEIEPLRDREPGRTVIRAIVVEQVRRQRHDGDLAALPLQQHGRP